MSLYYDQLIGILLCGLLSFWIIRWYLWGIKIYPLNPSARKKKEKRRNYPGVVFLYQIPAGDS